MSPPFLVFPKLLQGVAASDLARMVRDCGLDGVAVPVRDGYWCAPATLGRDLPGFVASLRAAGLTVPYAIIGDAPAALAADPEPLRVLGGEGIRTVRIGYVGTVADPRAGLAAARDDLRRLADRCLSLGVRSVVQLHHGTLHPSPSAAWSLVGDLPPAAIGVKLDPGNQVHEGSEEVSRSVALLGDHLAAVGVKDAAATRSDDGAWHRQWVPIGDGLADWPRVARALRQRAFTGPFVFSPFYEPGDRGRLLRTLTGEVSRLRGWLANTMTMEGSR